MIRAILRRNSPISFKYHHIRPFSITDANSDPPIPDIVASTDGTSHHIDAGSSIRKPISLWPGMYHSPVTNALWEARSRIFDGPQAEADASASVSQTVDELVARSPSNSRTSILYKFSSDYVLREQYKNPWNRIRMGKVVEDLDALAGTICFKVKSVYCTCVVVLHMIYMMVILRIQLPKKDAKRTGNNNPL